MTDARKTLPLTSLLCLGLLAAPALADEIWLTDGTQVQGEVSVAEATCETVSFRIGRSPQQRKADEVTRIIRNGDRNLDRALGLMGKEGEAETVERVLKTAIERGEPWVKPYAQFFLGELYQQLGRPDEAIAAFDAVVTHERNHFYAPRGLNRAADLLARQGKRDQAIQRLDRLASGDFGDSWKERGNYGKALHLLASNQAAQAKPVFAGLARAARTDEVKLLATCGEAECLFLEGNKDGARRGFETVLRDRKAPAEALGYAHKGLGDCQKDGDAEGAVLSYLRSLLLYPNNPKAGAAALAAAELCQKNGYGADQRLRQLAQGVPLGDYAGRDLAAELMRRALAQVSAGIVQRFAPKLAEQTSGDEKIELEFIALDAIKVVARNTNNAALLAEYETRLKDLQQKYPNHARSSMAGLDAFLAAKDRALVLIAQANEETDQAKAQELLNQGRQLFAGVIEPFKGTIQEMSKQADGMNARKMELERNQQKLPEADEQALQELEFQRDLAEFLLAEAYASFAKTYPESSDERKKNLEQALQWYEHQINQRGQFMQLLFNAYVGRIEIQLELGRAQEAIINAQELTAIEAPFPGMEDLVKDICIRAYYLWVKALVMGGKHKEAVAAAAEIDQNPRAAGWQEHGVGILLTFERAKALGGSGQGSEGARLLYEVVERARRAPENEKIPALGMSRIGAGACRALSELSDISGGEIYAAPMQYHVGVGYFLRQKPAAAVAAFKGVLTAAQTPEERAEWVPKAVKQIGDSLFTQERYLEAALAYETVFVELPDHIEAADAIRYALSASKRAIEQFGEDPSARGPLVMFYKQLESKAAEAGGEDIAAKAAMREAADLHKLGKWIEAAEAYLRVPETLQGKDGKTIKVGYYANAVANAGYCYFEEYKKSAKADPQQGNQEHLAKARESLVKALGLARRDNDTATLGLACYYLGQLELEVGNPAEALTALAPFDDQLRSSEKYLVRASHLQALAHLEQSKAEGVAKAEEYFARVEKLTGDEHFGTFAYALGAKIRNLAREAAQKGEVPLARSLHQKAARYLAAWWGVTDKARLNSDHYFWAGGALFDGGQYQAARAVYEGALQKFKPPALDGGEESSRSHRAFDLARMNLAYCLLMTGAEAEAVDAFTKLSSTIYAEDRDGRVMMRGTYKDRVLKGPFTFMREGREVSEQKYFVVIEGEDGSTVEFFETAEPGGAGTEFQGVPGVAPGAAYAPGDVRKLKIPYKRSYVLVDGMMRAAWARWEATKDQNFLATTVTAAANELRYVLASMGEDYYRDLVGNSQLEPLELELRRWQGDVLYLRVKAARELWREVVTDISMMKSLNKFAQAPAEIQKELDGVLALAPKELIAEAEAAAAAAANAPKPEPKPDPEKIKAEQAAAAEVAKEEGNTLLMIGGGVALLVVVIGVAVKLTLNKKARERQAAELAEKRAQREVREKRKAKKQKNAESGDDAARKPKRKKQ